MPWSGLQMMKRIEKITRTLARWCCDVRNAIAPPVCPLCGTVLSEGEQCLCAGCLARAEYAGYADVACNPMEQRLERLTGRAAPAAALLLYVHGEVSGRIVSAFNSGGQRALAEYAGGLLGRAVVDSGRFAGYDVLIPVPLHPERWKHRGYNQAAELCKGMCATHPWQVQDVLVRRVATHEQASLGRAERLANARDVFALRAGACVQGCDVLLVDDVFTTGTTVSSAANALYRAGARSVAVVCLCAG